MPCFTGTYSLFWNSTECTKCMEEATCTNKRVEIDKGYWRRSKETSFVAQWVNEEACLGGFEEEGEYPVKWEIGYEGRLWSQWSVTEEEKYERIHDFEWQKWPEPLINVVRVFGFSMLIFGFFMLIIVTNVNKTKESQMSVLLRLMTNYFQLLTTSLSMNASYPDSLTDIFLPARRIGSSSETFLSFDCFITDYEIKGPFDSNAVFKLFLLAFLPVALFALVAGIWFLVRLITPRFVKDISRILVISFISIVFLLHPKLIEQSIGAFRCIQIDDDQSVARIDTNID